MGQLAITAKIDSLVETSLKNNLASFIDMVSEGDLAGFEDRPWDFTKELYHKIAETVLEASAQAARPALVQKARTLRLGKLEERTMQVQIRTGHYVTVRGLYARQVPKGYQGARHLLREHWKLLQGA
jgi:hypothetical protein